MRDARRNCNDIHFALVDLQKAFDSVLHDTILRTARSLGLPDDLINYLEVHYRGSHTTLFSNRIYIKNGVRQGELLSPFLFNAVIDEGETSITLSVWFDYRAYCLPDYYSSTCDVYCVAQDSQYGHYTCMNND